MIRGDPSKNTPDSMPWTTTPNVDLGANPSHSGYDTDDDLASTTGDRRQLASLAAAFGAAISARSDTEVKSMPPSPLRSILKPASLVAPNGPTSPGRKIQGDDTAVFGRPISVIASSERDLQASDRDGVAHSAGFWLACGATLPPVAPPPVPKALQRKIVSRPPSRALSRGPAMTTVAAAHVAECLSTWERRLTLGSPASETQAATPSPMNPLDQTTQGLFTPRDPLVGHPTPTRSVSFESRGGSVASIGVPAALPPTTSLARELSEPPTPPSPPAQSLPSKNGGTPLLPTRSATPLRGGVLRMASGATTPVTAFPSFEGGAATARSTPSGGDARRRLQRAQLAIEESRERNAIAQMASALQMKLIADTVSGR